MDELKERAIVTFVDEAPDDREESLIRMRRRMIEESNAVAAAAIGGRTSEGGTHPPGVRTEVEMARDAGIPAFLLGATGGETALLAEEHATADPPYSFLNRASIEDNRELAITDDYSDAAVRIWSAVSS